ncbi:MAG: LPS export ABC transporter periplasmic protein LptC [Pseudomonadota bacterium]
MTAPAPPPSPLRRDVTIYTRVVRLLKIGLPLVALALMSALFLIPRETRFEGGLVYTSADLLALGEGLAVTSPSIAGATEAGEPFVVEAERAVPDGPDPTRVDLEIVLGAYQQAEGREITVAARTGVLRPKDQTLSLEGDVRLDTSDGYAVRMDVVEADLRAGSIVSSGPVSARGPAGSIEAGSFRARRIDAPDADAAAVELGDASPGDYLWFEDGVTVRWVPQDGTETDAAED